MDTRFILRPDIEAQITATCGVLGVPELIERISWRWTLRRTRWIGRATTRWPNAGDAPPRLSFQLCLPIFELLEPHDRRDTVIHEVCHLACSHVHGRTNVKHGPKWKKLMSQSGGIPSTGFNPVPEHLAIPVAPLRRVHRNCCSTLPFCFGTCDLSVVSCVRFVAPRDGRSLR